MHFEANILQSKEYYALCKYLEEVRFFLSYRDEGCTAGDNSVIWGCAKLLDRNHLLQEFQMLSSNNPWIGNN